MASIVEIAQASDVVTCDENGQAVIGFSINNKNNNSPRQRRVGFRINVEGETKQSWFEIEGKKELTLDIDATAEVKVRITAAGALPDHIYKFSLLVFDVTNMDEDYTESKVIALRMAAKKEEPVQPEPKSKKWLIWLIVGVVTISLAGVITFFIVKGKKDVPAKVEPPKVATLVEIPDVTDKTVEGATETLKSNGFNKIKIEKEFLLSKPEKTVLKQSPEQGTNANPEEAVITLTIADYGVKVPDLRNKAINVASQILHDNGLDIDIDAKAVVDTSAPEGTVKEQNPPSNTSVQKGTTVVLKISTQKSGRVPRIPVEMADDIVKRYPAMKDTIYFRK